MATTSSADPPGVPFPTVDVSGFLGSAAAELREGQLLHSESFSLFKAMGAIVIGDPKMDIWAKQMNNARAVPSVGEVLDGAAAPEKLTGPQLLAVMDRLVACESAWYSGNQAAQTLCTCMYLLRLDRLKCHPILYTYCASVKATCMQVRSLVLEGQVSQEEDFLPHLSGLPLDDLGPNPISSCVAELSSLEDALLSPSWAQEGQQQQQQQGGPVRLGCYAVDPGLRHALAGRLQLRRLMLMILGCLQKGGASQAAAASELTSAAEIALQLVLKTQGLAAPSANTDDPCPGFSAEVAQAALPPRPCAAVEIPVVPKALEDTKRLLGHLRHACTLTTSVASLRQLKAFLQGFAALKPGPLASAAAHVLASKPSAKPKGAISGSNSSTTHAAFQVSRDMVLRDLGLRQHPEEALPEALAKFADQSASTLRSWVRISCFNAAYRRRKLRRSVTDWAALLEAALSADSSGAPGLAEALSESPGRAPQRSSSRMSLACGPLSTWAEAEATQAILGHFWAGFELELYAPCEYCMVYWYLGNLTDVVLARTQRILEAQAPSTSSSSNNNKNNGGGKRQQKEKQGHREETEEEEEDEARREAAVEAFVLEARRAACHGMVHMFAGLRLAGLVSGADEFPFNGEQELFSQRFGFLQYLPCPEALEYGYFAQEMSGRAQMSPTVLFELAEMCFKDLVKASAALLAPSSAPEDDDPRRAAAVSEAASLRRVAQHNTVALQVARKLLVVPGVKLEVKYEFGSHPCFPVIGIKQKQQQKRAAPAS